MIRQRLGHVRHDTTGGDVYLRCLPRSFFARDPSERIYLTSCPRILLEGITAQRHLSHDDFIVPVYAAVLLTSKTTILRLQLNEAKLKESTLPDRRIARS